jgi:hypothetical protein
MRSLSYYLPGILLILVAIVIVAVPEILIGFIAALIMVAGIGALTIGHRIRKSEIEFGNIDGWFLDSNSCGWWPPRVPIFRRWR